MGALQVGNTLLSKLKELGAEGTLDSRPERIRSSVNRGKLNYLSSVLRLNFGRGLQPSIKCKGGWTNCT